MNSKAAVPFTRPPAVHEAPCFSTSSPLSLFKCSRSGGCQWCHPSLSLHLEHVFCAPEKDLCSAVVRSIL